MAPISDLPVQDVLKASGLPVQVQKRLKAAFLPYHSNSVPRTEDLAARAKEHVAGGNPARDATTMMVRNIPSKYSQSALLQEIDSLDFAGTYDFFYLPMDLHNRCNVGYGFINFLLAEDAGRFRRVFSEHHFQHMQRKVGSICVAHVQGLADNLKQFEDRAITKVTDDQYRPVILKDGLRIRFQDALAEVMGASTAATPRAAMAVAACDEASRPCTHARRRRAQGPQRKAPQRAKSDSISSPGSRPSLAPVRRGDQNAQASQIATDAGVTPRLSAMTIEDIQVKNTFIFVPDECQQNRSMSPHPRSRSLPPGFKHVAEVDANRARAFTHHRPASMGDQNVKHLVAQQEDEIAKKTTQSNSASSDDEDQHETEHQIAMGKSGGFQVLSREMLRCHAMGKSDVNPLIAQKDDESASESSDGCESTRMTHWQPPDSTQAGGGKAQHAQAQPTKRLSSQRKARKEGPTRTGWWNTVSTFCPVSGFPIAMLPYPPFKLTAEPAKEPARGQTRPPATHVDGRFLALHLIASFDLRVCGRTVTKDDVRALDLHLQKCNLGRWRVGKALALATGNPEDVAALRAMRTKATRELSGLRCIQKSRMRDLAITGQGEKPEQLRQEPDCKSGPESVAQGRAKNKPAKEDHLKPRARHSSESKSRRKSVAHGCAEDQIAWVGSDLLPNRATQQVPYRLSRPAPPEGSESKGSAELIDSSAASPASDSPVTVQSLLSKWHASKGSAKVSDAVAASSTGDSSTVPMKWVGAQWKCHASKDSSKLSDAVGASSTGDSSIVSMIQHWRIPESMSGVGAQFGKWHASQDCTDLSDVVAASTTGDSSMVSMSWVEAQHGKKQASQLARHCFPSRAQSPTKIVAEDPPEDPLLGPPAVGGACGKGAPSDSVGVLDVCPLQTAFKRLALALESIEGLNDDETSTVAITDLTSVQSHVSEKAARDLELHNSGRCRRCCFWVSRRECIAGDSCTFCHEDHAPRSRPGKRARMRLAARHAQAE